MIFPRIADPGTGEVEKEERIMIDLDKYTVFFDAYSIEDEIEDIDNMRKNQIAGFTMEQKIKTYKNKYLNNMKKSVAKDFYFEGDKLKTRTIKVKDMENFNKNMGIEIGD